MYCEKDASDSYFNDFPSDEAVKIYLAGERCGRPLLIWDFVAMRETASL